MIAKLVSKCNITRDAYDIANENGSVAAPEGKVERKSCVVRKRSGFIVWTCGVAKAHNVDRPAACRVRSSESCPPELRASAKVRLMIRVKMKVVAAPVIGSSWEASQLAGVHGE